MEEAELKTEVNAEDRRSYWQRQISLAQTSNLPISQFCREQGLAKASFYYWRRALEGKKRKSGFRSKDFVRVNVSAETVRGIRLGLGQGIFLTFDGLPSAAWVCEVAKRLRQVQ